MRTSAIRGWLAAAVTAALASGCNVYIVESADGGAGGGGAGGMCDPSQCPSGACAGDVCLETPASTEWSKSWGSEYTDRVDQADVDANDNVYIVGRLGDSVDFDSDVQSAAMRETAQSTPGIFIVKLDASGELLWHRVFEATQGFSPNGLDLQVTVDGSAYLTGGFQHSVDLGQGNPDCELENSINENWKNVTPFVAKFDPNGTCLWARQFGGDAAEVGYGTGVRVNAAGEILLVGRFYETMTFDTTTLSSQGSIDGFVAKLDAKGAPLWAKAFGGPGGESTDYIDADIDALGGIVVYGSFLTEASLHGTPIGSIHDDPDLFLVKYDADGNELWWKTLEGSGSQFPSRVLVDPESREIVLTGNFEGSFAYQGHSFESELGPGSDDRAIFVLKIAQDGSRMWASEFPPGHGVTYDARLDSLGNLVFGGSVYEDGMDFGGGVLPPVGTADAVLVKLDGRTGAHLFSDAYGSEGTSVVLGVAVDSHDDAIITGHFEKQITFDRPHEATPANSDLCTTDNTQAKFFRCYDAFVAKRLLP
ncbi:hypothetical protein ACMHYB_33195 [Sorangium sp. So ce1128]